MNTQDRVQSSKSQGPVSDPDATDEYNTGQIAAAAEDEDRTNLQIDYIDEALEESMPASDPPAATPTTGVGPPAHAGQNGA